MIQRQLTPDIQTSLLGLGTVKLGRNQKVKYPKPFTIPTDDQALALLNTARELGINLIDTAPAYGTSEARLGELLPHAGGRDSWIIASKVGENFDNGASTFDFTPEAARASVERSLTRLRTDRLDIVLIHSDGNDLHIIEHMGTLEALHQLKAEGLIRSVGMSTKTPVGALAALPYCDVLMLTVNQDNHDDLPACAAAAKHGVGVLVKKALASGHADPASSIRYAVGVEGVTSVIVGTTNPDHLRANALAATDAP